MKSKLLLSFLSPALLLMACGSKNEVPTRVMETAEDGTAPNAVTLYTNDGNRNYLGSVYSFRKMSNDTRITNNNFDLQYRTAGPAVPDMFGTEMVVDDIGFIFDVGARSCTAIKSQYPEEKQLRPLVWLAYSDASPKVSKREESVPVQRGHCFLIYKNTHEGRVVALFHVQEHVPGKSVVLDELELLDSLDKK